MNNLHPHSIEAEQFVLAMILMAPEKLDLVSNLNTPDDFCREAQWFIYQAMSDLCGKSKPVDPVTVRPFLRKQDDLEGVGGLVFLTGLGEPVKFATKGSY
jgi:replicative DNA helicase